MGRKITEKLGFESPLRKVKKVLSLFENERKKGQIIFWPSEVGIRAQIFSNIPAHDLNFHGGEGD